MLAASLEPKTRKKRGGKRGRFEAGVDGVNARNDGFNRKIERVFGDYTKETKANLERGTALPDR